MNDIDEAISQMESRQESSFVDFLDEMTVKSDKDISGRLDDTRFGFKPRDKIERASISYKSHSNNSPDESTLLLRSQP